MIFRKILYLTFSLAALLFLILLYMNYNTPWKEGLVTGRTIIGAQEGIEKVILTQTADEIILVDRDFEDSIVPSDGTIYLGPGFDAIAGQKYKEIDYIITLRSNDAVVSYNVPRYIWDLAHTKSRLSFKTSPDDPSTLSDAAQLKS